MKKRESPVDWKSVVLGTVEWAPGSDRRESPRLFLAAMIVHIGDRSFAGWGDVGLGGACWTGKAWGYSNGPVELNFRLPGCPRSLSVIGDVLCAKQRHEELELRIRFRELPYEAERAVARAIDDRMLSRGN